MTIRRRHVVYVPGYHPRGAAHYFRLFRGEFARFGALHGLKTTISRPHALRDAAYCNWVTETVGQDWQVETTYELLRWDDVVRADARRPVWRKIATAGLVLARYLVSGMYWRMARAHWRFALFYLYPYLLLLALGAALAGGLVAMLANLAIQLLLPGHVAVGLALGTVAAIAALAAALRLTEGRTYLLYLFDDAILTDEYVRRRRPDWDARLALFADRLIALAQAADADEIVVVGHSSGSFMAVDVIAQALARDPSLGRRGPVLRLVTLGANLPLVGFHPAGGWFVERLQRVLAAPGLEWLDVQSRKDVMSFYPFNQATGHGLAWPGRARPDHIRGAVSRRAAAAELCRLPLAALPRALPVPDGQRAAGGVGLFHADLRAPRHQRGRGARHGAA